MGIDDFDERLCAGEGLKGVFVCMFVLFYSFNKPTDIQAVLLTAAKQPGAALISFIRFQMCSVFPQTNTSPFNLPSNHK